MPVTYSDTHNEDDFGLVTDRPITRGAGHPRVSVPGLGLSPLPGMCLHPSQDDGYRVTQPYSSKAPLPQQVRRRQKGLLSKMGTGRFVLLAAAYHPTQPGHARRRAAGPGHDPSLLDDILALDSNLHSISESSRRKNIHRE